eukprot:snap_masked-scaffold_43-processed-gene-1.62-mRNA-1 protein AED:0.06 eAED:0.08 QI:0/-1/0/1/-1/1/1/0/346
MSTILKLIITAIFWSAAISHECPVSTVEYEASIEEKENQFSKHHKRAVLEAASVFPDVEDVNPFIHLKGGDFLVGTNSPKIPEDGEGPRRKVFVDSFFLQKYEVSVLEYAKFVSETAYVTDAEKYNWSFVFDLALTEAQNERITEAVEQAPWWLPVSLSSWFLPTGVDIDLPEIDINIQLKQPVAHVSFQDSLQYCKYYGYDLPTEEEFEFAALADFVNSKKPTDVVFPWGQKLHQKDSKGSLIYRANVWQGSFPEYNSAKDGFEFIAPVDALSEQNSFGFYNLIGNVWEWTKTDWQEGNHEEKVKKGGSFLCHKSYCYRYRVHARSHNTIDSSAQNLGFRCKKSA